jgi:hypothetical protein
MIMSGRNLELSPPRIAPGHWAALRNVTIRTAARRLAGRRSVTAAFCATRRSYDTGPVRTLPRTPYRQRGTSPVLLASQS